MSSPSENTWVLLMVKRDFAESIFLTRTIVGKDWRREEKGTTEDEMVAGVGDGQGGLACSGSWGRKESDTTEWLNWTDRLKWAYEN